MQISPRCHYLVVVVCFSKGRRGDRLALLYVLGPMKSRIAPVTVTNEMARRVVWVEQVNECEIISGNWPTVGLVAGFKAKAWPIPSFFLVDKELESYQSIKLSSQLQYKSIRSVPKSDVHADRELSTYGAGAFKTALLWRHQQRKFPRYPDLMKLLDGEQPS